MWWCCGKTDKNQLGCKFGRHVCKEDYDLDEDGMNELQDQKNKMSRCKCCKQFGHKIEHCTFDPNLKTSMNVNEDEARILSVPNLKKMHIDS
jgi:hypothetical protein